MSTPESTEKDVPSAPTQKLPPDEAFELLAHDARFEILETLDESQDPLQFSELRDRVPVEDSGQFNYHLSKLVEQFVRKTERGYSLTQAGKRVVGATLSGGYTHTPTT